MKNYIELREGVPSGTTTIDCHSNIWRFE